MALLFLISLFVHHPVSAQVNNSDKKKIYRDIKKYYKELSDGDHPIRFINKDDPSVSKNNIHQIILIRHGKPMLNKEGWISYEEARKYKYQYDTVHVEPIQEGGFDLKPNDISKVFCSTLVRSHHTAELLFSDQFEIESDSAFIEFQNRIVKIKLIKLPVSWWQSISRFFWLIGLNSRDIETRKMAKERARSNATFLETEASRSGNAVLVGHGLLNRSIKKTLEKQGWELSLDTGRDYLSVRILMKIK